MRILLDSVHSVATGHIVSNLRGAYEDVFVLGVGRTASTHSFSKGLVDSYEIIPEVDCQFVNEIVKLCDKYKIDVVFSLSDVGLSKLSNGVTSDKLRSMGTRVIVQPKDTLGILASRTSIKASLSKVNVLFDGPFIGGIINPKNLRSDLNPIRFPCIIKSDKTCVDDILVNSTLKSRVVNNWQELYLCGNILNPVVCEYQKGHEFFVDAFSDNNGNLLGACIKKVVGSNSNGICTMLVVQNQEIYDVVARAVKVIGIVGPSELKLFKHDNRIIFYSVRPRISSTVGISLVAGFDVVKATIDLVFGNNISLDIPEQDFYHMYCHVLREGKDFYKFINIEKRLVVEDVKKVRWWHILSGGLLR